MCLLLVISKVVLFWIVVLILGHLLHTGSLPYILTTQTLLENGLALVVFGAGIKLVLSLYKQELILLRTYYYSSIQFLALSISSLSSQLILCIDFLRY